jgi:hypothetical protein
MRATGPKQLPLFMIIPALVLVALSACYSWKVESAPLPELLAGPDPPQVVRVTLPGDFQMEIAQPRIDGDSLVGIIPGSDSVRRSVPASGIDGVATKRFNAGQTALVVLGPPLAILAFASMISIKEFSDSFDE